MIRLLSKQEIDKAKTLDKSREIAEGLKISKRVDSLRELQSQEERSLEKFRGESLSLISKEISEAEKAKDTLLAEVKELRAEKERGLKDVENKLILVTSFRNTLDQKELRLDNWVKEIEKKEAEVKVNLQNSADELERVRTHKEEAQNLQLRISEDKANSERILRESYLAQEIIVKTKNEVEKEFFLREQAIARRENDCLSREKANDKLSIKLNTQKLQLEDRESTLEREFNRLHK